MRQFCSILFCFTVYMCFSQNNLRLISATGTPFTAYYKDSAVNKKPSADVLIEKVTGDTINIKVELVNKLNGSTVLYLLEKGQQVKNTEFKYLVEIKNNKVKITYSGVEDILPLPSPLVPLKPIVDTSYKLKNNILGHYCELKEGKAIYFNNIPKNGECSEPMPASYMNYMNSLMTRAHVEDDRFVIAENTCINNCISVGQLNGILKHIPYEIEKLKLVRLAYFHVTDKQNREKLDSTFKLESSKKELLSFFKNSSDYKYQSGLSCTSPSADKDIDQLCEKISIYSNDTERLNAFKKLYTDYCFTTTQAKKVLLKYIHDREKLDTARLLYYHCVDKENFLNLSDVFSYTTTAADLKEFVSKQK